MSPVRKVLEELYKLSEEDRARVRAELDSWDEAPSSPNVTEQWDDEIRRRVQSIKDGSAELVSDEDAQAYLRQVLARHPR